MRGRSIPLSIPRRIIADYMRLAATIPNPPVVERTMDLGAAAAARAMCSPRPPWVAIFTKAYALTAQELPELRRVFLRWPWPRLYEYSGSVAMVSIDRVYQGEDVVLPCVIKNPAARGIGDIAQTIRHAKQAPLDEIKDFRRAIAIAKLPEPLRRLLWAIGFNSGRQRGNYFGTVVVSTVAGLGASALNPPPLTTMFLSPGFIGADQRCKMRLAFDHRVFDGVVVARAMMRLEAMLNTAVVEELRAMKAAALPAPGARAGPAREPAKPPDEADLPAPKW